MSSAPLGFDEFRAISARERNRKEQSEAVKANSASNKEQEAPTKARSPVLVSIGEFIESHYVQLFIVLLLILDILLSFFGLLLTIREHGGYRNIDIPYIDMPGVIPTTRITLKVFGQITMGFYTFEIVVLIFSFGVASFFHLGYLFDAVLICCQLYAELRGWGSETRILNFLRFWRLVRLANYHLDVERSKHEETREELTSAKAEVTKVELELKQLQVELAREKEARDSVESMLQNYREEVDTLNEALKIAAMDIADVAQADDEDFGSDDDDDDVDGLDDIEEGDENAEDDDDISDNDNGNEEVDHDEVHFEDAAASQFDRARNRERLIKLAQSDTASVRSSTTSFSKMSKKSNNITFLVNEDGSFQKK